MKLFVFEILKAVQGKLICGDEHETVTSVTINSKEVKQGALFVPLEGDNVDGHDYIRSAFENGATVSFTQRDEKFGKTCILVDDALMAMHRLASWYMDKLKVDVIGVTGSVGKTSTREMIACVLAEKYNTFKTKKNFNSDIGVPLTVFNIDEKCDKAVLEMGVGEPGEIARTVKIAKPSQAVITNIGISHIEKLGSQANILQEKLHITDFFDMNSRLFVSGDNAVLRQAIDRMECTTRTFGFTRECDFCADNTKESEAKTSFEVKINNNLERFEIPVIGRHNVYNALAAIAVGCDNAVPIDLIRKGLIKYKGEKMRQEMHNVKGSIVIDDCYNAGPESMMSAIDVLDALSKGKKSIAVLADMLELGCESKRAHIDLGEYLANKGIDELVTIGEKAEDIAVSARRERSDIVVNSFAQTKEAITYLLGAFTDNLVILVKGSRGMHLDEVVEALLAIK